MFKVQLCMEAQGVDARLEYTPGGLQVYAIQNDSCGYPMFLFWTNGQWIWKSAKYFFPLI